MTIIEAIHFLDGSIPDKKNSLPDDIFYFISRTTPLVNVDLLIQDSQGRTLLSWRDDKFCGKGWHVPGGIVRFQETLEQRIQKTAQKELGSTVEYDTKPIHFVELIHPGMDDRSHFISFLFLCHVPPGFVLNNAELRETDVGYLKWHTACPSDLIKVHEVYRKFISK